MGPDDTLARTTPPRDNPDLNEIATTFVMSRISEFWRAKPRLWFLQSEAIITVQNQGDDYKFNMVMAKVNKDEIQ